ncbi:nucleotidyltransferase family protein [Qipengyuania vesicularis]|uniref:nucleotidyltransferase family protein n=1 Tax=Qipengyuania vesicularis TaxID=2867232 RepID=UPI001C87A9FB|nr:nucleotidyltransferase family protein [Qipengyuania vesicularis]MBX7528095.1 nucleotidyltransferase family protein [Qipengyuania vesicularis]
MDDARFGRALLALCGHRARELQALSPGEWRELGHLADMLLLEPILHWRDTRGELGRVAEDLRGKWAEAYRENAIRVLAQRRALLKAVTALGEAGIGAVALKGSALAWTVYPAPAARAMRDIDLLVDETAAPEAYLTLQDAGWAGPQQSPDMLADFSAEHTHLPPLLSAEKIVCEVHSHVWLRPPLPGASMPLSDGRRMLSNARYDEKLGAAVPSREDMLAHLVVHAVNAHLLNVGPMALIDVDLLCAKKPIDWPAFWDRAREERFDRPAALLFALVDRWRRPDFLEQSGCPHTVASELLDETELLLVQTPEQLKDVSAIASLRRGRTGGRIVQHPLERAENPVRAGTRIRQLAGRATSVAGSLLSGKSRRAGLATARLQRWIET